MSIKSLMSFVPMTGFRSGCVQPVWACAGVTEDAALCAWAASNDISTTVTYAVDRAVSPPLLRWTVSGTAYSTPVTTGIHLGARVTPASTLPSGPYDGSGGYPGPVDVEGAWECDNYGRPFDVQAIKHY